MSQTLYATVAETYCKLEMDDELGLSLDLDGRWRSYRQGERFYRRTIKNQYVLDNNALDESQAVEVQAELQRSLARMLGRLGGEGQQQISGDRTALIRWLEKAQAWDYTRLQDQVVYYRRAYIEDIPVLPPDRYHDLVVLPATGCPNARCRFCTLYQGSRFEPLTPDQFAEHLQCVRALYGQSVVARDGIFLSSANALALSQKQMLSVLEKIKLCFGSRKRGIASFYDPEHAPKRNENQWRQLAALDLRHVVIGLETAYTPLREYLGKSGHLQTMQASVDLAKAAGINIGITVLIGMEDVGDEEAHFEHTRDFIGQLALQSRDIIYLSPWTLSKKTGLQAQLAGWKTALRSVTAAKVVEYGLERFFYFA